MTHLLQKTFLNVVIVEDEALFRMLLAGAIEQCGCLRVIGCYGNAQEALASEVMSQAQVAVVDIDLGSDEMDGIQLGVKFRELYPQLGVVLLSNHPHLAFARALIAANFVGWAYLLKKSVQNMDTVRRTLEGVSRGEVILDPQLVHAELAQNADERRRLTPRQLELWQLITQGFSNVAIAKKLDLSTKWIDNAVGSLYRSLDIDTHDPQINARVAAAQAYARATQNAYLNRSFNLQPGPVSPASSTPRLPTTPEQRAT